MRDEIVMVILGYLFFFFFQAEDGIRDRNVTGVQTCALPISAANSQQSGTAGADVLSAISAGGRLCDGVCGQVARSEERRVGKSVDLGGRRIIKKKRKEKG